jgi:hypothetical protein
MTSIEKESGQAFSIEAVADALAKLARGKIVDLRIERATQPAIA